MTQNLKNDFPPIGQIAYQEAQIQASQIVDSSDFSLPPNQEQYREALIQVYMAGFLSGGKEALNEVFHSKPRKS